MRNRREINLFDYRSLLKKYMRRVLINDGVTLVSDNVYRIGDMDWQEQKMLEEVEREVIAEKPSKVKAVWK